MNDFTKMENFSFASNLDHIFSKIQIMSHENRNLSQFINNKSKITILKIELSEVNNMNIICEQNSEDGSEEEEFKEMNEKTGHETNIGEDVENGATKDDEEATCSNKNLKRKKVMKQNQNVKRRR